MQMLRALMVPVWCQWGALLQHRLERRVPMGAEQARFSPCRTLLGCKFVLVKKCQRRELSCLLWQTVDQERAPSLCPGWEVAKFRNLSNTHALSTLLPLPRDHCSTQTLALCKRSSQTPYQPFKCVRKNWQGKAKGRRAAGAIQESSVFSGNLFQLIHFSNSCRLQSLLT